MIRILNSEPIAQSLRIGVYDAVILAYAAYILLGIWGAAVLFRSYIRLTNAAKEPIQLKAEPVSVRPE
jgi:hypothetical protein